MHRSHFLLALVLAGCLLTAGARAATETFHADMNGQSETPPNQTTGTGTVDATFDTATRKLDYIITWHGLTGPAGAGHFHGPADKGAAAGPVVVLGKDLSSPVKGSATLTAKQAEELEAAKWYVNIHTAAHPGGEVRGQVEKAQ